ncbi:MAG: prolipoprotein diacylglyceryl transferase family protein [Chloroflexota bacterium]
MTVQAALPRRAVLPATRALAYRVCLAMGVLAGALACLASPETSAIPPPTLIIAMAVLTLSAAVGCRALYAALHWRRFVGSLPRLVQFGNSGLSIFGGLMGTLVAGPFIAMMLGVSFWRSADILAPFGLIAAAGARMGCAVHGCCRGRTPLLPLSEAVFLLSLAALLRLPAARDGTMFLAAVACYAVWRLATNQIRADRHLTPRRTSFAAAALAAACAGLATVGR